LPPYRRIAHVWADNLPKFILKNPFMIFPAPGIIAEDLVKNLLVQIEEFKPGFTLGERVESLEKQDDESYIVTTNEGTDVHCKVVVIAAGLGSFEPRKPAVESLSILKAKAYIIW
jgi:thioredoxin reductase (NADPH)